MSERDGKAGVCFGRLMMPAAMAGLHDTLRPHAELPSLESLQIVALWCLFATGPALGILVLLGLLRRLGRARMQPLLEVATFYVAVQALVVFGAGQRWYDPPFALLLSLVVLAAALLFHRRPESGNPWRSLASLLGMLLLALLSPWLRPLSPSAVPTTLLVALVAAGVARLVLVRRAPNAPVRYGLSLASVALCTFLVNSFLPSHAPASEASRTRSPHVVLLVLDTQRADQLGCYDEGSDLTPNLDKLAAISTLYENAFAPDSWTVPSHASLFTGLYSATHGCSFRQHRWLEDGFTTLAERLQEVDYQTAGFSANGYLRLANLHQGFEVFHEPGEKYRTLQLRRLLQLAGFPSKFADHGAFELVNEVEEFLREDFDPERPLFLFLNLLEPHWRYLPALLDRWHELPEGVNLLEATRMATQVHGPLMMAGKRPQGRVEDITRGLYRAAVRYQDRQLGRLLPLLDSYLDPESTLLVVTADHGENLGEAGRFGHVFAVNDHLIHVPLLIRDSAHFEPGQRCSDLVSLIDLAPTILDLVPDAAAAEISPGQSLLPGRHPPRDLIFVEGDPYLGHLERMSRYTGMRRDVARFATPLEAVRDARFKLVVGPPGKGILYDLEADPDETEDCSESHPEVRARLEAALDAWRQEVPRFEVLVTEHGPGREITAEELALLRAMGYEGGR